MKKLLTYLILPLCIIGLAYLLFNSIRQPVQFKNERAAREAVAIQQLKDIRTLQTTFKSSHGYYAPTMDTLIDYYKNGNVDIVLQIGSADDSVAFEHTAALKKANKKITNEELYKRYLAGDKNIIVDINQPMPVKDTLFNDRPDFDIEALRFIPFSEGDTVIMKTIVKLVSGVNVPLFEAQIPYGVRPAPGEPFKGLLQGLDEQQIINLNAERTDTDRYPGLMVGSIDNPNNNAGNWE
jgi:hypothetical protein